MQIKHYQDTILSVKCDNLDVEKYQNRAKLANQMLDLMKNNNSKYLTAPQVGINIRMFVWEHLGYGFSIWDPIIQHLSGFIEVEEQCLSVPQTIVKVRRATYGTMIGTGINKFPLKLMGISKLTPMWQHAIDHLDGILITNYL